jgi:hypothetical protein
MTYTSPAYWEAAGNGNLLARCLGPNLPSGGLLPKAPGISLRGF